MKIMYLLLSVVINSFLALLLPFILVWFVGCISAVMFYLGYDGGVDQGEESLGIYIILFTAILIFVFANVIFIGNRIVYENLRTTKTAFTLITICFFIAAWIANSIWDPFHIMWKFNEWY